MHHVRRFLYQSGGVRQVPQRRSVRHLTADLRAFSQDDLDAIAAELNNRPRKIHGYRTPARSTLRS
ncbi:hypothetical protein [Streptosporangium lutulentum]|uniref:IS30 family transposase n=1 Tax=Streptosporangium lutulentum TaxID=1461250 RepID=A0ABT9QRK3_9ACTN|nr:hypothetical protein [Streptosporangium lutulentum]MDP9849346.1 IS30 family transposase [Streptosporangium lutulentum]